MAIKSRTPVPQQPAASATNTIASVDIREAKPPVPLPSGWAWIGLGLLAALLAALAASAWLYWKRRRAQPTPEIQIPPHLAARDQLRAALALLGRPEPFCVAVSRIIRVYLERQFDLRAPERTTEEFLEELRASALLSLEQKRSLADFLSRCDLVKFARYEPGEPELRGLYDAAVRLVEETEHATPAPAAARVESQSAPVPARVEESAEVS